MENALFVIVITLCVILIVLLGVVTYFLIRFVKLKEKQTNSVQIEQERSLQERMPEEVKAKVAHAQTISKSLEGRFCVDHPEMPAKGICSISGDHFCELCITKERDVRIARKYLHMFLDTDWQQSYFFNDFEMGETKIAELMRVKADLWRDKEIPVIAQKQFKINIENDDIETYTAVMTREEDKSVIDTRLGFLESE